MKLGLQIVYFTYPGGAQRLAETFGRIVRDSEEAGFYSVWVMDHFIPVASWGTKELEMLEGYSALSYAAAITNRVKLGTLVTGVTHRHPGILVKTATTLDVLSGGRSYFGIGAAWRDDEHAAFGMPFPPLSERFEILEETLQLAHQMWIGDEEPYESKHLQLQDPLNNPNSLQRPHPPIMIGGEGEQKTFRLIAKYGDACNPIINTREAADYLRGVAFAARKYEALRARCEEEDRSYEQIEKTTLGGIMVTRDGRELPGTFQRREQQPVLTPSAAIEYFHALAEAGTDHAIINTATMHIPGAFDLWASDVIPAVEKLVPLGRHV